MLIKPNTSHITAFILHYSFKNISDSPSAGPKGQTMTQPVEREPPSRYMRLMQRLMPRITPLHAWMYRALGGRLVGSGSGGAPVVLVTTRGRRTGRPRTVVLGHLMDGDDVVVPGTNGGLETLPSWILNLQKCSARQQQNSHNGTAPHLCQRYR